MSKGELNHVDKHQIQLFITDALKNTRLRLKR